MEIKQCVEWSLPRSVPKTLLRFTAGERKYLLYLVDLLLLNGALLAAVTLWNGFEPSFVALQGYAKWFITLSVLWLMVGTVLDIYNLARAASTTSTLVSVGSAAILSTSIYLLIPWLTPLILHRTYVFGFVLLTTAVVVGWRVLYAQALVQPAFRQRGLFVGGAGPAFALVKVIHEAGQGQDANPFRGTGYEIVGRVAEEAPEMETDDGIPFLGDVRRLVRLTRQCGVDEIILAAQAEDALSSEVREVLLDCQELGIKVSGVASVYERLTGRLPVEAARYDLRLLLSPADNPATRLYLAAKRIMDIVLAVIGLMILGLLLPFVALANAIASPGPLFYRQERLGRGGRPFPVIKLRSMVQDAERLSGAVWCGEDDPRITPVGRFLRKSRLDEAPQLLNVLRGEMSIVGPRPERPHFVGQLAHTFPLYRARHAVKPGITGWAQVHHEYGDSVEDARIKLEYDLFYVKHANLYLDLLILLHTVRVVLGLKGR
jgi:exopolysaccharide biosynthesis polyprenyl glycosylphosphotransferase